MFTNMYVLMNSTMSISVDMFTRITVNKQTN